MQSVENKSTNSKRLEAWILLILLSLVWGSSFILIKRSLLSPEGLPVFSPFQVGFGRIFFAGLVLFPIFLKAIKKASKKHIFWSFIVGLIGNSIPAILFARAEQEMSSALAGMLNGTTPFFTIIIGALFFAKKHKDYKWIGILVGFLGAAGLSLSNGNGDFELNYYVFMILAATFCYGISVNIIADKLHDLPALHIVAISLFLTGFPQGILLFCTDFPQIVLENPHGLKSLGYLLILAIIGTAVALIYFNKLIKLTDGIFGSTVTYLIPIVAILWGFLVKEAISVKQLIFMGVILLGVFITNRRSS